MPPVADSVVRLVETSVTLAIQTARTGDFEGAKHLLEQALGVIVARIGS